MRIRWQSSFFRMSDASVAVAVARCHSGFIRMDFFVGTSRLWRQMCQKVAEFNWSKRLFFFFKSETCSIHAWISGRNMDALNIQPVGSNDSFGIHRWGPTSRFNHFSRLIWRFINAAVVHLAVSIPMEIKWFQICFWNWRAVLSDGSTSVSRQSLTHTSNLKIMLHDSTLRHYVTVAYTEDFPVRPEIGPKSNILRREQTVSDHIRWWLTIRFLYYHCRVCKVGQSTPVLRAVAVVGIDLFLSFLVLSFQNFIELLIREVPHMNPRPHAWFLFLRVEN